MTQAELGNYLSLLAESAFTADDQKKFLAFWSDTDTAFLILNVANKTSLGLNYIQSFAYLDLAQATDNIVRLLANCLLHIKDDDYKMLGVSPLTHPESIKQHYKLLMRLFHPDKTHVSSDQAAILSSGVNQAYTRLTVERTASKPTHFSLEVNAFETLQHASMHRRSTPWGGKSKLLRRAPVFFFAFLILCILLFLVDVYQDNQSLQLIKTQNPGNMQSMSSQNKTTHISTELEQGQVD